MEKSLEFYQEIIGLSLKRRFDAGPETEICFLGDGDTQIELISDSELKPECVAEGITMGFEIESADEIIKHLSKYGIEVHSGPFQPNPHIKFFYIKDPDGFRIQLVENIK
jgi:lactoylglutathione lyase